MSFKLNDYNAFLTSLFDKQGQPQQMDTPLLPGLMPSQQPPPPPPQPYMTKPPQAPGGFPVDFDFGLLPTMEPPPHFVSYNHECAGEIGASAGPVPPPKLPLSDPLELPQVLELPRPRVKLAHNIIEQRYRNKINEKFTALQMLVPALRLCAKRKSRKRRNGEDYDDDELDDEVEYDLGGEEDLEGLEPARKLNKGTILAKLVEYIKFLEVKNERMKYEHQQLIAKAKMMGLNIDDLV